MSIADRSLFRLQKTYIIKINMLNDFFLWHCTIISYYKFCCWKCHSLFSFSTKTTFHTEYFTNLAEKKSERVNNDVIHDSCWCGFWAKNYYLTLFVWHVECVCASLVMWLSGNVAFTITTVNIDILLGKKKQLRIHHFIKYGSCGFSRVKSVTNDIQFGTRRKIFVNMTGYIITFLCVFVLHIPDLFLCGSSFNHQWTFSMLICYKKKLILRVYPLYASKVFHQFYEKSFVSSEFYGVLFFLQCCWCCCCWQLREKAWSDHVRKSLCEI